MGNCLLWEKTSSVNGANNGAVLSPLGHGYVTLLLSSGIQVVITFNMIHAHWWKTYRKGKT